DDSNGGTVTKTLNFNTKVSQPTIDTLSFNLLEDNVSTDNLNISNPVGGVLTYEILTAAIDGEFTVDENGLYNYNPAQDYNGSDSVTIKVTNEYGLSTTSTLTFDIEAVNDAPVANVDTATTFENLSLSLSIEELLANDTDVDINDTMTITNVTAPLGKGVASLDSTTGNFIFEVGSDFDHLAQGVSEDVSVVYTIEDAEGASSSSEVIITITGTNDKPIIEDITAVNTKEDAAVVRGNITSTDVDDNSTSTYSTTQTVAGFILNSDGSYSFNPADNEYQSLAKDEIQELTISVTVTDEQNATDTKDLVITVVGTNDVPTVVNASESFTLTNIRDLNGKVEASDIDGDTLSYTVSTTAMHGVVAIDEIGNWHYRAEASFNGEDSAIVTVDDGNGGTVTSILNFTVEGYIYEGGDLVIDDVSGDDTLVMDSINKNELTFERVSDDLELIVSDQGVITLKNYFDNVDAGVEVIETAQGDISLSKDIIDDVEARWHHGSLKVKDELDHLVSGSNFNDWLRGAEGNDIMLGIDRNDSLLGKAGDDLLIGGNHNDRLYGGIGDDNLYGDSGNDRLYGNKGDDSLIGGSGRDFLFGNTGDDWISGDKDRDYLKGGQGNDKLFGGSDRDRLYGEAGNDFIVGGKDNDRLYGGRGDDTYHFEKGDVGDTIYDKGTKSFFRCGRTKDGGEDTITFGQDITKEDISFTMKHGNLFIQYGEEDMIKVENQSKDKNKIEKIELFDGNYLTNDDMDLVIQQISAYGADNGMHRIDNTDIQNNNDLMNIVTSAWNT
ncbi:MAG: hypothetical protein DRG78_11450, partial [Epsilonproteobacteria bacterium]